MIPPEAITPAQTRAFLALARVYRRDGRATLDTIAAELGDHRMSVYHHLRTLDAEGLIEIGKGRTRPLLRAAPLVR